MLVANAEPNEQYSGGENATTFNFGQNAFGIQVKGLTSEEEGFFVTGNAFFRSNWVTAPASVQTLDGLGPIFNAISCGSCHFKDGRAKPPSTPEEPLNGLLFRLSTPGVDTHGEPLGDPYYGGQLQDKAILTVKNEARVRVTYQEMSGQYVDGSVYSLRQPNYEFLDLNYGSLANGWMYSPRIAPQMPGLGLLEIVPEAHILALADENDTDNDGISGKANRVWNYETQQVSLGRFGWKANQPSLSQQTAAAF
ncbi:MAG: di-heme oxidoredictase family protein, partial [Saprospiraceae bacterium]